MQLSEQSGHQIIRSCENSFVRDPPNSDGLLAPAGWYTTSSCTCELPYGGSRLAAQPQPQWMSDLWTTIATFTPPVEEGRPPNAVCLLALRSGTSQVPWQTEEAPIMFGQDGAVHTSVLMLFGHARRFQLQRKGSVAPVRSTPFPNGLVIALHGQVRQHYLYRLPAEPSGRKLGPSFLIAWQWIKQHTPLSKCPEARKAYRSVGVGIGHADVSRLPECTVYQAAGQESEAYSGGEWFETYGEAADGHHVAQQDERRLLPSSRKAIVGAPPRFTTGKDFPSPDAAQSQPLGSVSPGTLMAMPAAAVLRLLAPADPQDEWAQIAQASLNSLLDAQSKHDRWTPSRERIDAALQTWHLRRVAEALGGNCQFSALARFVFKDPALHNVIRQAIVEIIELARNHYGCYLAGESPVSYCERMRKEGEWGDALTLQAFCDFAGVQAILITDLPEFSEVTVSPLHSFDRSALHELASAMGFLTPLTHFSARISAVPPQLTLAYFSGWHYDSVVSASEAVSGASSDGCHALDHPAEDALSIAPPQPGPDCPVPRDSSEAVLAGDHHAVPLRESLCAFQCTLCLELMAGPPGLLDCANPVCRAPDTLRRVDSSPALAARALTNVAQTRHEEGDIAACLTAAGWEMRLAAPEVRSWCLYKPAAISPTQAAQFFRLSREHVPWTIPETRGHPTLRKTAWFTLRPCVCAFRYSGQCFPANEFPPWLFEAWELLRPLCQGIEDGRPPDGANFNMYRDESDSVGWHADDEPLFDAVRREASILSLSLGDTRAFEVKRRGGKDCDGDELLLGAGDAYLMHGLVQRHFVHRVPKGKSSSVSTCRINITFRWIRGHVVEDGCPLVLKSS